MTDRELATNLARLRAMHDLLADVDFGPVAPIHRMPGYVIGVCRRMVADALKDFEPDLACEQLDRELAKPQVVN